MPSIVKISLLIVFIFILSVYLFNKARNRERRTGFPSVKRIQSLSIPVFIAQSRSSNLTSVNFFDIDGNDSGLFLRFCEIESSSFASGLYPIWSSRYTHDVKKLELFSQF